MAAFELPEGLVLPDGVKSDEVDTFERKIAAVFIPADTTQPIQQVEVLQPAGQAIGCFTSHCKHHFARSGMSQTQMSTFREQVVAQAKGKEVTEEVMSAMASMTTCDIVPLQPNNATTGFVGVNLYCDDKGVAKQLPHNVRASSIGQECGLELSIMGDAFVARQFDNDEGFCRFDFTMADLDTSMPWMRKSCALNKARRSGGGGATNMEALTRRLEADKLDDMLDKAQDHKAAGNKAFQGGNLVNAVKHYTEALMVLELAHDPSVERAADAPAFPRNAATLKVAHLVFSNRSACSCKLGRFDFALRDAEDCTAFQPKWAKGWGRLADALVGLGRQADALEALETALKLAPKSVDLLARRASLKAELEPGGKAVEAAATLGA